jgi:hypothetical protein
MEARFLKKRPRKRSGETRKFPDMTALQNRHILLRKNYQIEKRCFYQGLILEA